MSDTATQDLVQIEQNIVDKLDPKYFFFDLPLYEAVKFAESNPLDEGREIIRFSGEFDAYNYRLKENSTYEGVGNGDNARYELPDRMTTYTINLRCKRTGFNHIYYVIANKNSIEKVGQYPSLADLNIALIREYKDVLSSEKLKEFIRGIGLRAHGVGIGSFVYLRRIFEYLIEQEHLVAQESESWDEESYHKARMTEKITILQSYLPTFLVENKDLYSILSLGVHELSEDQCLQYFDSLKMGIEEILDEKVIQKQREKRRKMTKKSLEDIRQTLKNTTT